MNGEYYLHTNGSLIHKSLPIDDPDSTFIVKIWQDRDIGRSPQAFLTFLQEAYRLGATQEAVMRLHDHNDLSKWIPNAKDLIFFQPQGQPS